MKNRLILPLLIFVFFSFAITQWQVVNQKGSIIVYNTEIQGYKFKKSKVENTIASANFDQIQRVLLNINNYKNWQPSCAEAELLKRDDDTVYYRLVFDAPWPVTDREIVLKSTLTKTADKITFISKCIPDYIPANDDYVRIEFSKSDWLIKKNADGSVFLRNSSHSNPGGNIPAWLSSSAVEDLPLETMENFCNLLK